MKYYSLTFWFPLFILFSFKIERDEAFVICRFENQYDKKQQEKNNSIIDISGEYELIKGYTLFLGGTKEEILTSNLIVEKLSDNDFGYYAAHKIKGRRPSDQEGILRNYKGKFHQLSFCEYDESTGFSRNNFEKGFTLYNQVIIKKKEDKLVIIQYGGNFRTYLLYKKLKLETDFSSYLTDALDRAKIDYHEKLTQYHRAKNYDERKLSIEYIRFNESWASKHVHKEGSKKFEKTHYYQSSDQDGKFEKEDEFFFQLLER
ncbi:hypothetical protein ACOSP6_08100 [Tenacibaculum sp. MEBiC06402]|uniref:hypothetical protein n=1 Tax=unclassified Tenacibaculum TaxID=2635139 RepID=UPI003B9BF7A4